MKKRQGAGAEGAPLLVPPNPVVMEVMSDEVQAVRSRYEPEPSETTSICEGRVERICEGLDERGVSGAAIVANALAESWSRIVGGQWRASGQVQTPMAWAAEQLRRGVVWEDAKEDAEPHLLALARFAPPRADSS